MIVGVSVFVGVFVNGVGVLLAVGVKDGVSELVGERVMVEVGVLLPGGVFVGINVLVAVLVGVNAGEGVYVAVLAGDGVAVAVRIYSNAPISHAASRKVLR